MMRVVEPDRLILDAAETLEAVVDDVVVIGATAVRIVLGGTPALVAATRDVDAGVAAPEAIPRVVRHLEQEAGMRRSELPHERSFTWVRGDLKVQLLRGFFPFARPPAKGLPVNTMLGEVVAHREAVAFAEAPERRRLWVAGPAALVGLKREAFGRTRPDGGAVARDYSDVVLLLDHRIDQIAAHCEGDGVARRRVLAAVRTLADESDTGPRDAAIRELVAVGAYGDEREAERGIGRVLVRARRALDGA